MVLDQAVVDDLGDRLDISDVLGRRSVEDHHDAQIAGRRAAVTTAAGARLSLTLPRRSRFCFLSAATSKPQKQAL